MRDHAQVRPRMWTHGTIKELRGDREAREMAFYLMTAPTSNLLGLWYLPLCTMRHELGGYASDEEVRAVLQRLIDRDFAMYDDATEHVWVINMCREQVGEDPKTTDNRLQGVRKEIRRHRKTPFYAEFCAHYSAVFGITFDDDPKPPKSPSGAPSKGSKPGASPRKAPGELREGVGVGVGEGEGGGVRADAHAPARESAPPEARPDPTPPDQTGRMRRLDTPDPAAEPAAPDEPASTPPPGDPASSPPAAAAAAQLPPVGAGAQQPALAPGEPAVPVEERQPLHRTVRVWFEKHFYAKLTCTPVWDEANMKRCEGIAAWLEKNHAGNELVALKRLLRGFFENERALDQRFPIAFLAKNPPEYYLPASAKREVRKGPVEPAPASAFTPTNLDKVYGPRPADFEERLKRAGANRR